MKILFLGLPFLFLAVCPVKTGLTQSRLSNTQLIKKHQIKQKKAEDIRAPLQFENQSPLIKYNPITLISKGSLFLYQNVISPQMASDCIYHPSCSDFSKQAIQQYGFFKGICLGADRLSRCTNLAEDEIDLETANQAGDYVDPPERYR